MTELPQVIYDTQAFPDRATIKIVKANSRDIIPSRRDAILKRLDNLEAAFGRALVAIREIRADVTHLTVE